MKHGWKLPSPAEKVNMLSKNDPASVPFSMIDMDPEVNQLDTVTGVSPTMGTLGLGLGTVGLPNVIVDELDIELTSVTFYTDSRVVLG